MSLRADEAPPADRPRRARLSQRPSPLPPALQPPPSSSSSSSSSSVAPTRRSFDPLRPPAAAAASLDGAMQGLRKSARHYAELMGSEVRHHPR